MKKIVALVGLLLMFVNCSNNYYEKDEHRKQICEIYTYQTLLKNTEVVKPLYVDVKTTLDLCVNSCAFNMPECKYNYQTALLNLGRADLITFQELLTLYDN
jgi:hypothetical protein